MTQELKPEGTVALPIGKTDGEFNVNLRALHHLEKRQAEVQYLTKVKAPELMTALNRGYLDAGKLVGFVRRQKRDAEKRLGVRKAVILLHELPRILREKEIEKANDDIRAAVCATDAEYVRLEERVDCLATALEMFILMQKGFEKAHGDAKRIYDQWEPESPNLGHTPGRELPAHAYPANGKFCSVCDFPQYDTPHGAVCAEGHGGASGYTKEET